MALVCVFLTMILSLNQYALAVRQNHQNNLLEAVFWELKPFLYLENGTYKGMYESIFSRGHGFCNPQHGAMGIHEKRRLVNRTVFQEFLQKLIKGDLKDGEGVLEGINKSQLVLGPIVKPFDMLNLSKSGFQVFEVALSNNLAVFVSRYKISLISKILYGISKSRPVFLIAVMGSIICCVAIWFVERNLNNDFSKTFTTGCGSAFWWSMASMTTVGYGDLVPKSPIGRLFALCWIFFGVLLGCLMTATMSDAVSSVDFISIKGQRVAVLEDSYESLIVETQHMGIVVHAKSYDEVLDMVRRGEVYAGVIVDKVAAWMQLEMHRENKISHNPISIVKTISGSVHFMIMMRSPATEVTKNFINCMYRREEEVYTYSIDLYNKYLFVQTIFINENLYEMFEHDIRFRSVVILFLVLMTLGLSYDLVRWLRSDHDNRDDVATIIKKHIQWFFGFREVYEKKNWTEDLLSKLYKNGRHISSR